jgi:hypothetical protein
MIRGSALRFLLLAILLSGCAAARPEKEIEGAVRALVAAAAAGDRARVEAVAPFLHDIPDAQRQAAMQALAGLATQRIDVRVRKAQDGSYAAEVRTGGPAAGNLVVPFRRAADGRWEIQALVEQTRHIDIVPARR